MLISRILDPELWLIDFKCATKSDASLYRRKENTLLGHPFLRNRALEGT